MSYQKLYKLLCIYINFCIKHLFYRPYWRCYYSNTDAVVYVIDSVDRERMGIAKDELMYMLKVSYFYNVHLGIMFL